MKHSGNRVVSLIEAAELTGPRWSVSTPTHSVESKNHVYVCTGSLSDAAFNQIPF